MKKLTREEASKIEVKAMGRTSYTKNILVNMKVGDIVLLETKDWTQKDRGPSYYVTEVGYQLKREYSCQKALDGSGWVLERLK